MIENFTIYFYNFALCVFQMQKYMQNAYLYSYNSEEKVLDEHEVQVFLGNGA